MLPHDELYHYGVLGMRWGVRKDPRSLSDRGKKRATKKYIREVEKAKKEVARRSGRRYIDAYNEAAARINSTRNSEFNKTHSPDSANYQEEYNKYLESLIGKNYERMTREAVAKNKHYKRAEKIAEKYSMTAYSDVVKSNREFMSELLKDKG